MGRISEEDVRRVRDATDLVGLVSERVVLKQKGRLFWGCCPFHQEKTASFKVDPATQLWHCFGCGLGGDAYGFVMRSENLDFADAVRTLAERARIEITFEAGGAPQGARDRLVAANESAAAFYHDVLTKSPDAEPQQAREYLSGRGFGSDVARTWRLGYAPGRGALVRHLGQAGFTPEEIVGANLAFRSDAGPLRDRFHSRIMFPIIDLHGRVIAFGGRILGQGEPKYLNTQDTLVFHKSANLYGIDLAKATITTSTVAIVVEGYTDVIALHSAGITNAVATLGTALTREHVQLLGRFAKRVVYLFDGDEAGLRAADRAAEFVDASVTPEAGRDRVSLDVAVVPAGLDPADFVSQHGKERLDEVIAAGIPLLRFAIDRRLARWDLDRPEERSRALKEAAAVLAPVKGSLLTDDYAAYIAGRLFADVSTVKRAIVTARVPARPAERAEAGGQAQMSEPDTPQVRTERDLLDLLLRTERLRCRACFLLTENLLTDARFIAIAQVICESGAGLTSEALSSLLEARHPGSAVALAAATLGDVDDSDAEAVEHDLERKLKEFDLERRIADGRARLRDPDSFGTPAEYDELFGEVSALQQELDRHRREARRS